MTDPNGVSRWLDAYLAAPGRAICVAAGNAGQEKAQSRRRSRLDHGPHPFAGPRARAGLEVELEWTVVGDGIEDRSENELEIWDGSQDRFAVAVQAAWRADVDLRPAPREFVENHRLPSGTTLSIYNELYHPTNGANYIAVYLSPNLDPGFRGIRGGVWKVRLTGEDVRDGRFNAWIERDDPARSNRHGGRRHVPVPVVLHRNDEHRFPFDQLTGVRSPESSRSRISTSYGQRINATSSQGRHATGGSSRRSPRPARTSSPPTASASLMTPGLR